MVSVASAQPAAWENRVPLWAPEMPTLWPRMLLPRRPGRALPFPFNAPSVRYVYLARNGLYALARQWNLAGKEVLFPAYYHGVELQALLAAGVQPRFFPVHAGMRVEPDEVISLIGPQTTVVYLTHYLGYPGPVEPLQQACEDRGLLLIEDCALSLLSSLDQRPLGTFGHAAIFCLYKSLPTLHGGAVALKGQEPLRVPAAVSPGRAATVKHALSLQLQNLEFRGLVRPGLATRLHALSKRLRRGGAPTRVATGTNDFELAHVGLLMSHLCRVIIAAQPFEDIVRRRRRNYLHLAEALKDVAPPIFPDLPAGMCPLSYPFAARPKQAMWEQLRARGVETVNFWSTRHPLTPEGAFPEVDVLRETVLEIPCHQDLTPRAIERLAGVVREAAGVLS